MKVTDVQFQLQKRATRAHPIVKFLWDEMNAQQVSQEIVAARAGIASSTLRKYKYADRAVTLGLIEAALNVLGYDLVIVPSQDGIPKSGRLLGMTKDTLNSNT
jgi:transcriptional regulator with XRE-family HTH domain